MTTRTALRRDERGMSYVFIGMGLMAFMGASMLAIDVGMLMTARNQAQNSADAGALAGALALFYDDYDDRTATGPAVTSAIAAATRNDVMAGDVSVTPDDVVFPPHPITGENNRVQVTVYRRADRGNAMQTQIARFFGIPTAGVAAIATAEVSPADAVRCPLPFTIPDRWTEVHTPEFDPEDDYDAVDKKNNPVTPADVYIGPDDKANYTGYNAQRDKGIRVVLKADNGSKLAPSMYQVWDVEGGNRGSDDVRDMIANCRSSELMQYNQTFVHKPGMQTGPVGQGISDLIAQDPGAYWDATQNKVITNHPSGISPRVRPIPLFDPYYYDTGIAGGRNASLKFVNYLGFFIEEMRGQEVVGIITPISGQRTGAGAPPAAAFPAAIRLVQ
jgi:Flp pilus assembly protein TadG